MTSLPNFPYSYCIYFETTPSPNKRCTPSKKKKKKSAKCIISFEIYCHCFTKDFQKICLESEFITAVFLVVPLGNFSEHFPGGNDTNGYP